MSSPTTLHDATIEYFINGMATMKHILQKAKEHAPEEAASYPSARLYPDMLPLSNQVQIASNAAKNFVKRVLPERDLPVWEDNEETLDQLFERIDKTVAFLKTITPADLAGVEAHHTEVPTGRDEAGKVITGKISAKGAALAFAVPNFNFHLVIAYAILRVKGVPLGKKDFLTTFVTPYLDSE